MITFRHNAFQRGGDDIGEIGFVVLCGKVPSIKQDCFFDEFTPAVAVVFFIESVRQLQGGRSDPELEAAFDFFLFCLCILHV